MKNYVLLATYAAFLGVLSRPAVTSAQGTPIEPLKIYQGGLSAVSLEQALSSVQPGSVVVLGEQHGTMTQAEQQVLVMETLRHRGLTVSVGMEFFDVTQQSFVDQFRGGTLSESDFLKAISWGGFPFAAYREQTLFPELGVGHVVALNVPRSVTGRIAKVGVENLTPQERSYLPVDFTLGNSSYKARFREAMGGHVPSEESFLRYFAAQSAWDDSMALKASEFLQSHPDQVLVIVVGEFHSQYGGGLPDRLKARGVSNVLTFSLINLHDLDPAQQEEAVRPSPTWGQRGDFVWTSLVP